MNHLDCKFSSIKQETYKNFKILIDLGKKITLKLDVDIQKVYTCRSQLYYNLPNYYEYCPSHFVNSNFIKGK